MEENDRPNREFGGHWAAVVRRHCELIKDAIPYLALAEQNVYQRLFPLSHVQQSPSPNVAVKVWTRSVACQGYRPVDSQRVADESLYQNGLGE
jgi:hypothetical protein